MRPTLVIVALVAAVSGGCRGDGESSSRLDGLEARLERLEQRTGPDDVAEVLRGIDADLQDLERRFGAFEMRRQRGPVRRVERSPSGRSEEIRAFRREFREKQARLEEEYADDPDSPEYRAATLELRRERERRFRELSQPSNAAGGAGTDTRAD